MKDEISRLENPGQAPENGWSGLRHWRQDALAGFVVALVSVPLSLGIALASGAPPVCGLTSEIIAGLIFPFLGGAYVTVSGPAAGLAPVLYSTILSLGQGNLEAGYRLLLPVIMFAGLTQLLLTYLRAARFSYLIPRAAIQGMLAAIGLLIIAKQIPHFIGHKYHAHEFFGTIMETPSHLLHLNPAVFAISIFCLLLLFILPKTRIQWLRIVPPHLIVVLAGMGLGQLLHIDSRFLVQIPANPLAHGIVFPDFQGLFSSPTLIPTVIFSVLALTFVDGTESLATIHAVDQIDPFKRRSDPQRTLLAMGVSNICSSLIGGLTIIPGIIKSSTCIVAGGRTAWVNFYNALFLAIFLVLGHEFIRLIPVAALSAVLVHIGYKLAGPHQWQRAIDLGPEQLLVFSTTVLATVFTDLLVGIFCGIFVKLVILAHYAMKARTAPGAAAGPRWHWFRQCLASLFRSPISEVRKIDGTTCVLLSGPLTCFNTLFVRSTFEQAAAESQAVKIVLTPDVGVIDHSSATYLRQFTAEQSRLRNCAVTIEGLDCFSQRSRNRDSLRCRA